MTEFPEAVVERVARAVTDEARQVFHSAMTEAFKSGVGNPDHAGVDAVVRLALSASPLAEMVAALRHYADTYCEGWCEGAHERARFDDCGGCLARRVVAFAEFHLCREGESR